MQILIAAGGTGGGVYPALAIAEAVQRLRPDVELTFVGSVDGFERPLVAESGVRFARYDEFQAGPLHGVGPVKALVSLARLAVGTAQAFVRLLQSRPDALLLTGGWVGVPVALAAWALRIPSLIYLPDIEPGLTIRALRPFADQVAITAPESAAYFAAHKTVVTGYPLRQDVMDATRSAAQQFFALDPARKTLLVFGGSRGARSINQALLTLLPTLLQRADLQIIHITGTLDWQDLQAPIAALGPQPHYHAYPYLHREMGLALAGADLVVSRAGASVLGEFPFFGLPSILVPYPYAWRYQKVNADMLAERGAAYVMRDADMERDLLGTINALLDDPERLAHMAERARSSGTPDGARRAAEVLLRLAAKG